MVRDINIQNIFDILEQKKPSEVMRMCGYTPQKVRHLGDGHIQCLCPFPGHHDHSIGSFDLNDNKRVAKCFSCQQGGRPIRFYRDLNGLTSDFEAGILMAEDYGLITAEERQRILGSKEERQKWSKQVKTLEKKESEILTEEPPMQPLEIRSAFYEEFIRHLPLRKKDRDYLQKERGFAEADLKDFFGFSKEMVISAFEKVQETLNWAEEQYIGIPGVFCSYPTEKDKANGTNKRLRFFSCKNDCLGLAIRDFEGQIIGIQLRNYQVNQNQQRYFWLSSAFANRADYPLFSGGRSSDAPAGFEAAIGNPVSAIGITEGKFKAMAMARYRIHTFTVQGVGNWRTAIAALNQYLEQNPDQKKQVWLAFDADEKENPAVAQSMYQFYMELSKQGYSVSVLDWDSTLGKGIDDVLSNGYGKQIHKIKGELFIKENILPLLQQTQEEKKMHAKRMAEKRAAMRYQAS